MRNKTLLTLLSVVLVLSLFSFTSCSGESDPTVPQSTTPETSTPETDDGGWGGYVPPIRFDTLEDLASSCSEENEEEIYSELSKEGATKRVIGNAKYFITKFQADNIAVPCLNGNAMTFRSIALFAKDHFKLPALWFNPTVATGENLYINYTYLPSDILENINELTISEIVKRIGPLYPNLDKIPDNYDKVYIQDIQLKDLVVSALVYEYKNDIRNSYRFVYGEKLVEVRGNPEVWDEEWFASLSFEGYNK